MRSLWFLLITGAIESFYLGGYGECKNPQFSVGFIIEESMQMDDAQVEKVFEKVRNLFWEDAKVGLSYAGVAYTNINETEGQEEDVVSDESIGLGLIDLFKKKVYQMRKTTDKLKTPDIIVGIIENSGNKVFCGLSKRMGLFCGESLAICVINKNDTLKNISEYVGHEIAHLLGSFHDSDTKNCNKKGSLMWPVFIPTKYRKKLSKCTIEAIKNALKKKKCS